MASSFLDRGDPFGFELIFNQKLHLESTKTKKKKKKKKGAVAKKMFKRCVRCDEGAQPVSVTRKKWSKFQPCNCYQGGSVQKCRRGSYPRTVLPTAVSKIDSRQKKKKTVLIGRPERTLEPIYCLLWLVFVCSQNSFFSPKARSFSALGKYFSFLFFEA